MIFVPLNSLPNFDSVRSIFATFVSNERSCTSALSIAAVNAEKSATKVALIGISVWLLLRLELLRQPVDQHVVLVDVERFEVGQGPVHLPTNHEVGDGAASVVPGTFFSRSVSSSPTRSTCASMASSISR